MTVFLSVLWTLVLLTAQPPAPPTELVTGAMLARVHVAAPEWELTQLEPLVLQGRNLPAEGNIVVTFDTAVGEIQETVRATIEGTVVLERTLFAPVNTITIVTPDGTAKLDASTAPQQVTLAPVVLLTRVVPFGTSQEDVLEQLVTSEAALETATEEAAPIVVARVEAVPDEAVPDEAISDEAVPDEVVSDEAPSEAADPVTPDIVTSEPGSEASIEPATPDALAEPEETGAEPTELPSLEPANPAITPEAAETTTATTEVTTEETAEPRTVPAWLRALANVAWYLAYTLVGVIVAVRITLLCKYWVAQSDNIEAYWREHKDVPRFARLDIVRYFSLLEKLVLVVLFALTLLLATLGDWAQRGFSESVWSALTRTFTNPWSGIARANPPGVAQVLWYVMLAVFLLAFLLALIALVLPRFERAKHAPRTPLYVVFALLVPGSGLVDEDAAGLGLVLLLAWAVVGLSVLRELYDLPFQFELGIWGGFEALAGVYLLNALALLAVFVWSRRKQQPLERTVA